MQLNINTDGFDHESIYAEGEEYTRIRIAGCGYVTEEGMPELPYIRKLIAVPECEGFDVGVTVKRGETLEGFMPYPAPRRSFTPEGGQIEIFSRNEEAYSGGKVFPEKRAEIVRVFYIRSQRVAELRVYPIRVNTSTGEAEFAGEIELNITYKSPYGPVCVDNGPMSRVCESSLINYGPEFGIFSLPPERPLLTSGPGTVLECETLNDAITNGTDYMIVVGHVLWEDPVARSSIMQLASKRANFNGFNVSLIDVDDIATIDDYNDHIEIKGWLYDLYHSRSAGHIPDGYLGYVLLVGDAYDCATEACDPADRTAILPPYYYYYYVPNRSGTANDMPYASFDDEYDLTPDIFIGRLCADDAGETAALIDKIVGYEPHAMIADPEPWYRKFLFIGGHYGGLHELGDEVEAEVPSQYFYDEVYKDCQYTSVISAAINSRINAGVSIIVEGGHGVEYNWGSNTVWNECPVEPGEDPINMGVWNAPYYETLNNQGLYPVIYAFSCLTANFDFPKLDGCHPGVCGSSPAYVREEVDIYDCMAERLTVMPGRGAAGYVGYTRSAPAEDMATVPRFVEEMYRIQGMVGESVTNFYYQLINDSNRQLLVYIGDPALNPFFVEDQVNPSDDVDVAVVQDGWTFTEGAGETVDVHVRIRNVGVIDVANVYITLKEGETLRGDFTIPYLGAYAETTVSMNIAVSGRGHHQYDLAVDPFDNIDELNPDNNTAVLDLDYNPDFAVVPESFVKSSEIFDVGGTNTLEVTVVNQGVLSATDVPWELTEGPGVVESDVIDTLLAGEEAVISVPVEVTAMGNHDYVFTVNPGASLDETFLDNNADSISIAAIYNRDGFPLVLFSAGSGDLQYAVPTIFQSSDEEDKRLLYNNGVINSSGTTIISGEVSSYYYKSYDIPIANVTATDGRNIVGIYKLPPSGDRRVRILDSSDLQLVSELPFTGLFDGTSSYEIEGEALTYDLDRDGMEEIIYIERNRGAFTTYDGMMKIFSFRNGSLTEVASYDFIEDGGIGGYRPLEVAIEDVDFDNIPEIAVIGYHAEFDFPANPFEMIVDVFRYDTSLEPVRHENHSVDGLLLLNSTDAISGNITMSDIDGDYYLDLVATVNDAIMTISGTDIEFNTANLQKIGTENTMQTAAYGVDIDGTGNKELVMASKGHVRILSVDAAWNLAVLYSYDVGEINIASGPLISDIDGDGYPEIIVGAKCDGQAEDPYYQITVLDHNLSEEAQWEPVRLYGILDGSLAVEDIDRDGEHELFLMARTADDGILYAFGTPWASGGEIFLPMEKGNNQHTNASKRYIRGTFGGNVTLCREVEVIGDLQVDSPGTLFVAPGTDIAVLDSDPLGGGAYPQYIEILCGGGVSVKGLDNLEAVFHSNAADPQAFDWYGLVLETNNLGGEVNYCRILHAGIGIYGKYSTEPVTVNRSGFRENQVGLSLYSESIEVTYTSTTDNTNTGMIIAGYQIAPATALVDHCTIRNNYYNGLVMAYATGVVQYSLIENNGVAGMLCLGACACPEVKHTSIVGNDYYGVQALYDSSPILGDVSTGKGGNNSIYNSPTYVYQDYSSPTTVIMAQNCYWGTEEGQMPAPGYFKPYFTGNIVYHPILLYDPIYAAPPVREEKEKITAIALAQNYPNPVMSGGTSISYSLPSGRSRVSLKIYDVAGRTVKTLVDAVQTAGTYNVKWDGLNNNGSKVAQGIYFYRLIAGEETVSRKMIFLK